jgi:hypothetical protein
MNSECEEYNKSSAENLPMTPQASPRDSRNSNSPSGEFSSVQSIQQPTVISRASDSATTYASPRGSRVRRTAVSDNTTTTNNSNSNSSSFLIVNNDEQQNTNTSPSRTTTPTNLTPSANLTSSSSSLVTLSTSDKPDSESDSFSSPRSMPTTNNSTSTPKPSMNKIKV